MPVSYIDDFRTKLLRHYFGNEPLAAPANLYAMPVTTAPAADGSGVVEAAWVGLARVAILNNSAAFTTNAAGQLRIANQVTFTEVPAGTADINIVGIVLYDAAVGGTPRLYFPAPKTVGELDTYYAAAGTVAIELNNPA